MHPKQFLLILAICLGSIAPSFAQDLSPEEKEALGLDQSTQPGLEQAAPTPPPPPPESAPVPEAAKQPEPVLEPKLPELPTSSAATEPEPSINSTPKYSDSRVEGSLIHKPQKVEQTHNRWAVGVFYTPRAFKNTNFKAAPGYTETANPKFWAFNLQGERVLLNLLGDLSAGVELGLVSSTSKDHFDGLVTALITGAPYVSYKMKYSNNPIVIPMGRAGADFTRYNYRFNNARIKGYKVLPMIEAGLGLNLNFFDSSSAGEMYGNNGVKRSIIFVSYLLIFDSSRRDLDLTDKALRAGFSFEF